MHKVDTLVLILDEVTAGDLETDDLVPATIRQEFSGWVVVLLDQGNIAEFDSPDNLLANNETICYSMARKAGIVV